MNRRLLAVPTLLLLITCAAYKAQHSDSSPTSSTGASTAAAATTEASSRPAPAPARADAKLLAAFEAQPLEAKQLLLVSEIDRYMDELKANGQYDCCVKPACRQCALTAGECHCREVIDKNGPCCGECTQAWVEGRGDAAGVDREKVLEHLGCVRELYEKKVPEGVTPPGQAKPKATTSAHSHH